MRVESLKLSGTFKITLEPRRDERGYFVRTYDQAVFLAHGLSTNWVQESQSYSIRNIVRGMHFQRPPFSEVKLVRALWGRIVDVLLDLRKSSETYGQWDSLELSAENHTAVYIPKGFAHGFCTPDSDAVLAYKMDSQYVPEAAGGLLWNDPDVGINWPVQSPMTSESDEGWPALRYFTSPFE